MNVIAQPRRLDLTLLLPVVALAALGLVVAETGQRATAKEYESADVVK